MTEPADDLHAIGLLQEPVRRRLYEWVVAQDHSVGRDEAAAALDIGRSLAAFHLDRLADAGMLSLEFRRLTGRTGPGAGRPAKLYRRSDAEFDVSIPDRRYRLAARLFAEALDNPTEQVPPPRLRDAAHSVGVQLGAAGRTIAGPRASRARRREALTRVLADGGYEPEVDRRGVIRLRNCPFDALVADHRDLVCGMNLAMAEGVVEGLGAADVTPALDVQPGYCCVAWRPTEPA
jgi:predicted ArsR family transcriptional regulator